MLSVIKQMKNKMTDKERIDAIIKHLDTSVAYAMEHGEYNEAASWPYQNGVLLDYKEANLVSYLLKKYLK